MRQRYLELHLAFERALAFPAGEDLAGADRRLLEDLQAIAEPAIEIAVQEQPAVLTVLDMRNVHRHVADLGIEQQTLARLDAHAAVLDQHVAVDVLHLRPTGLEIQRSVVDLEEQADAARLRRSAMVQRALVLEIALIDIALDDGAAQPFIQRRAEYLGQVLGGVATIALGKPHAQVHVALSAFVEQ